jgi:short-subunit dehydrogenase
VQDVRTRFKLNALCLWFNDGQGLVVGSLDGKVAIVTGTSRGGGGSIVNISSGAGHPAGSPTLVSYGAAKSGLNHLTRSLAQEWGPQIRVNCLALGPPP